jgi:hypothetical protein
MVELRRMIQAVIRICQGGAHNPSAFRHRRRQKFTLASRQCPRVAFESTNHLAELLVIQLWQRRGVTASSLVAPAPREVRDRVSRRVALDKDAYQRRNPEDIGEPCRSVGYPLTCRGAPACERSCHRCSRRRTPSYRASNGKLPRFARPGKLTIRFSPRCSASFAGKHGF